MIESPESGTARRVERAPLRSEAELTFMLARPAVTRLQFETERLRQLANSWSPAKRGMARMESELGLAQIKALADRIEPLTESQNMVVRFEAQETLVALSSVAERLGSIFEEMGEEESRSVVKEIKAATFASIHMQRAEEVGGGGHAAWGDAAVGRDLSKRQAARFDARYIDYLLGRTPSPAATNGGTAAQAMPLVQSIEEAIVAPPAAAPDEADEETVRNTAYLLWEQDGRPEGRANEYWRRALDIHRSADVRAAADRPEVADSSEAPLRAGLEPVSLFQAPTQETNDAFAELAATLRSLSEESEAPETVARAASLDDASSPEAAS